MSRLRRELAIGKHVTNLGMILESLGMLEKT